MSKSIITKYEQYSVFSGRPAECLHHLLPGKHRSKADKFLLTIPLTNDEHNMSFKGTINQIHGNPAAEKLSRLLGQMAFEKDYLAHKLADANSKGLDDMSVEEWYDEAREAFRKEFGESYL